jgi:MoxR-like ATPase
MALAFSKALSLEHNRMQFTPDVLPSDITGFSVFNKAKNVFEFRPGVAFCNLFLADEINRTSSKTQSALLELMEEKNITVDGITYKLPEPYTVIATQNPIGSAGTHNLPDSQLDRFMLKLSMGYPEFEDEVSILKAKYNAAPLEKVNPVANASIIKELQEHIASIYVDDRVYEYIVSLSAATRNHPMIKLGVSPRGTLALMQISKGIAVAMGRDYVIPDDVSYICRDVFEHRIILSSKAKLSDLSEEAVINEIIKSVKAPGIAEG